MGAAAAIGAAATIGSTIYTSNKASKASNKATKALVSGQQQAVSILEGADAAYEKVDLDKLQALATKTARENAIRSLALEKELSPGVAATRSTLQQQVADELALGGKLSPDVANQVARQAIASSNQAGLEGGSGPITAAMLGLTAMDVAQKRKDNATALLAANPTPASGLSAGSIASQYITDQTNLNTIRQNQLANQASAALGTSSALATNALSQGKITTDATKGIEGVITNLKWDKILGTT